MRRWQRNDDVCAANASPRCRLDFWLSERDNATTRRSEHCPDLGPTRRPGRGSAAYDDDVAELVDILSGLCSASEDERRLLQVVLEHLSAGGIAIRHAGDVVLTWPDGGVSRRIATGEGT